MVIKAKTNSEQRISVLNVVLKSKTEQNHLASALQDTNGNWSAARTQLAEKFAPAVLTKLDFAHSLGEWSGDNLQLVQSLTAQKQMTSLRDVALHFNLDKLVSLVDPKTVPATIAGATPAEKQRNFAVDLHNRLFTLETSAVLERMASAKELPIENADVRSNVARVLGNVGDLNIRTASVYTMLDHPNAFRGVPEDVRGEVVGQLKVLQRVQALSPAPEVVPAMMKAGLTSALQVSDMPESTFMDAYAEALGGETYARHVYTQSVNVRIRNEHALVSMRESARGSGLAIIDGQQPREERITVLQRTFDAKGVPLNLDTLFGGSDFCECDECLSVYSPASYFVELLNYLRNNNLDKKKTKPDPKDISGTPLEALFRRRPDLGCLELTCENTFTVLPYIDLVNEVMESFVVHLDQYKADKHQPKQAVLDVFNVDGETTGELLAQPQHINYEAYCILKNAVYPFTLPYHQPIDAIRIFLDYLGSRRYELLDTFRTAHDCAADASSLSDDEKAQLQTQHETMLTRAVDAEFLGLTQEEYIILVQEAFWPKRYFEITMHKSITDQKYRDNIGVRPVYDYYGYKTDADMLSVDETAKIGLTFVKDQFLPRTGLAYTDLVDLLKTRFINPDFPQGKALTLLESIRFSYRFLLRLVNTKSKSPKTRFAKLVAFLKAAQHIVPLLEALLHPDPCHQQHIDLCDEGKDLEQWVYCYFDRIGKLIVLDSGESPELPVEGNLYTDDSKHTFVGILHRDGTVYGPDGKKQLAHVDMTGHLLGNGGTPLVGAQSGRWLRVASGPDASPVAMINAKGALVGPDYETPIQWTPARDTCDLEKVRLVHLDGSALTDDEYDRMHRFIRLWHKLGWSIDEVDKALTGSMSGTGSDVAGSTTTGGGGDACQFVGFDEFKADCADTGGNTNGTGGHCSGDWTCPDPVDTSGWAIDVDRLHQFAAIRKLLDKTGLPLTRLLSFWADISTVGDKSLYASLFLTHNLTAIDPVFQADKNGNYLGTATPISAHIPVLMAALKLKAEDIQAIVQYAQLADNLNLANVSAIYRHSLLAKLLHLKPARLGDAIDLFGNPFASPEATLALLKTWGRMEDAGFEFRQLDYLIQGRDDALHPLAPAQKTILATAKTLYDKLNAIDHDHPDIAAQDQATDDLVQSTTGLLFPQAAVGQIVALLDGTTVYTTNAPANQSVTVPDALAGKLKYIDQPAATPPRASIQVTGILTDGEITLAKGLLPSSDSWRHAIDRIGKQTLNIFNDVLEGIFPDDADAKLHLLAGDVAKADAQDPDNTAPKKRFYFLQYFMPFLRARLAHRLIVTTLSAVAGISDAVADVLLTDILVVGSTHQPAIDALQHIKDKPSGSGPGWKGYLLPPADGTYTFSAIGDTQPPAIRLDGRALAFTEQQQDPNNVWFTAADAAVQLKAGQLYLLEVDDRPADALSWKSADMAKTSIASSQLLPDYSVQGAKEAFTKLTKSALLVNGFGLSADELGYLHANASDFDDFDFNAVTLPQWKRLQAYAGLRDKLPVTDSSLLDLFAWATHPDHPDDLSARIAGTTQWKQDDIDHLISAEHFDLNDPANFRNEVNLVKLEKALAVAKRIGVDIDRLFKWAAPGSRFHECHQIAQSIRSAIRARFSEDDWEQVVRPLNDQLREHQKQALISYLLVQPVLIDWGVVDADSLFEFFLIDVQMSACMETSRIKQAISSVQLFVQRCMLGLEEKTDNKGNPIGVAQGVLDRDRWDWMQKYRVWEANRKVFLYPENWIEPQLRDDKSEFYKALESELLQKDTSTQNVQDALKNYLFKVDEVANMDVVGLYLDGLLLSDGTWGDGTRLHVFGRTRNAPYAFYYRYFHMGEMNWYPWERMQVDVPSYDAEDGKSEQVIGNGCFLIPAVWNNRLFACFPQIVKKTRPAPSSSTGTFKHFGEESNGLDNARPKEYYEIKMGWSEYRNGKWTQKQVSKDALYSTNRDELHDLPYFKFVPIVYPNYLLIDVDDKLDHDGGYLGAFQFDGHGMTTANAMTTSNMYITDFNTEGGLMYSWQINPYTGSPEDSSIFFYEISSEEMVNGLQPSPLNFRHAFSRELLGSLNHINGVDEMYAYYQGPTYDKNDAFGSDAQVVYHELKRPYALYNWEIGFHAVMQLVDRQLKSQQFDQALKSLHYVLDPSAVGSDVRRFWKFPPFKEIDATNVLEDLFYGLQPNKPDSRISEWRDKPFQPHVVARSRPASYMKYVAMKYIEVLIAYGDYYFRQFTMETIPLAIQCYVLASHIYGKPGQKIPKRGKVQPQTYRSLLDKWDAFGNAMVELELAVPFSNQITTPIGVSNGVVGFANIFGFATTLYFCIPDNPKMRDLRKTIDDRLFKIRHCQDINGVVRHLPLFEPPIDPGLLVQAAAQGLSLSSVLNELDSPMPNYRFYYLLQKALELCGEVKALGNTFLSIKEKGDAETLGLMRAKHESAIQNLVMEVKKQQLTESQKALETLQESRRGPVSRMQYYLRLIGDDLSKVPDANADFSELANQIEKPITESGLKLIAFEKEEMDMAAAANQLQSGIGQLESLASVMNMIPNISANLEPLGTGASISFGGSNIGASFQAMARNLQTVAGDMSFQSTNASRKAGFLRQLQDRVEQANAAGYEIKHIDKQILAQQIRIDLANQEITNQQKQIDNAKEVEDFLRDKYTNAELYAWMEGQVRTLYYQAYSLAYDLAKRAEKVFGFERGPDAPSFIQPGYWNVGHDGLLAGEQLYVGLKQLEAAYQEKRGYDFEISMPISLRQLDPLALLQLKEQGGCEFTLPEALYDMVRPGDYMRRIKSVALTVPCVVGPYTSISGTLRLLEHKFRSKAAASSSHDYPEKVDATDDRFSTVNVPITSIATGSAQNDSGVFELNFHGERYLPFEGAGAISKWRLEFPAALPQFDYETITDVIIHLRYTARDGGDKLRQVAAGYVTDFIKSVEGFSRDEGLFAAFDVRHDFPNAWTKASQVPAGPNERDLALDGLADRLPIFAQGHLPDHVQAKDIYLVASANATGTWQLSAGGNDIDLTAGPLDVGSLKSFAAHDCSASMAGWTLKLKDAQSLPDMPEKLFMVVRYVLT